MIEANLDSAIRYIEIAAAAGDARADHNLAYLLMNDSAATAIIAPHNDKVAIDSLALYHLRRASDAGLPAAMTMPSAASLRRTPCKPSTSIIAPSAETSVMLVCDSST